MAAQNYTKKTLITRIQQDLNNGFPGADWSLSDNEILFHIDQAMAFSMVGQVYNLAKLEGTLTVPEAYLSTYSIGVLTKNEFTGEWYATLPQPPVSLPLGYSITNAYFASSANGKSAPILPIEAKRGAYRDYLPKPTGTSYRVGGSTIYLKAHNGASLQDETLYVEMVKSRTVDVNERMEMPDDAIEVVYNLTMDKLRKRIMNPQDIVKDDLPQGNKAS